MSAGDDQIAATIEDLALTMRGTVYTLVSPGGYTNQVKAGLKCSLTPAPRYPASTSSERADLASAGVLEWERSYTMPDGARVEVDAFPGQRWNVQRGTVWPDFGPDGGTINYRAEVKKAT